VATNGWLNKNKECFVMRNSDRSAKIVAITAVVAAIYVVLTVAVPIPAHGPVQFRFSELLNLLVFFNPIFAPGIILGCLIANMFSEANVLMDMIFGTLATVLALFCVRRTKKLYVAAIWPIVFNAYIIGVILMLSLIEPPYTLISFLPFVGSVGAGQTAVMIMGCIVFAILQKKNPKFIQMIRNV